MIMIMRMKMMATTTMTTQNTPRQCSITETVLRKAKDQATKASLLGACEILRSLIYKYKILFTTEFLERVLR